MDAKRVKSITEMCIPFFTVCVCKCVYMYVCLYAGSSVRNVNIFLVLQDTFLECKSSHLGKTIVDTILRSAAASSFALSI